MNKADLRESRAFDDVIQGGQEVREQGGDTVPDDGSDQPSSPRQSEDHETSFNADISDYEEPTMPMSTFQTATIDCNSENNVQDQPSPGERQRPLRNASRPMRFRDAAFDTQFQPKKRRRNCKKIRRQGTTGNYVINKEAYFHLGRGDKRKYIAPTKNKEATSAANRQDATQTEAPPRPFTDTINPPDPAKTSKVLQKRLRPAALRSSSTPPPRATSNYSSAATGGVKIDNTVINARSDRYCTTRPTDAAAAVRDQHAAAMPIQKVKVNISINRNTDTTSVSVPGKIQITNVDCPTPSTHLDASKVFLQRRDLQINLADSETSSKSTESAIPDRIMTTTPTQKNKNKEITTSLENHQTKVHSHRFRRKKRQKSQRWTQRE